MVGDATVDDLAVAVDRLVAALRVLDAGRLGRPPRRAVEMRGTGAASGPGYSVADQAYLLAEQLTQLQAVAGDPPPDGVSLPRLADHAAADQLAVVGRAATSALERMEGAAACVSGQVTRLHEQLRTLRLQL